MAPNPEAMELAKQAVEHDTAGRLEEAIPLYERAAALILSGSPDEAERYARPQLPP